MKSQEDDPIKQFSDPIKLFADPTKELIMTLPQSEELSTSAMNPCT